MKEKIGGKLIFRWSLVLIPLVSLFWLTWYLISKSVPEITGIPITQDWFWPFPWGSIPRPFLDIPAIPIWTGIFIYFLAWLDSCKPSAASEENIAAGLLLIFIIALVASPLFFSLKTIFMIGLIISLIIGLIIFIKEESPLSSFGSGFIIGIAIGLMAGIAIGLKAGLITGLIIGLMVIIGISLGTGITITIIFTVLIMIAIGLNLIEQLWIKTSPWLLARDK